MNRNESIVVSKYLMEFIKDIKKSRQKSKNAKIRAITHKLIKGFDRWNDKEYLAQLNDLRDLIKEILLPSSEMRLLGLKTRLIVNFYALPILPNLEKNQSIKVLNRSVCQKLPFPRNMEYAQIMIKKAIFYYETCSVRYTFLSAKRHFNYLLAAMMAVN